MMGGAIRCRRKPRRGRSRLPSKSPKQAKFMSAIAHSPKFAKEAGVPQSVGKEFHEADKRVGMIGKSKPNGYGR